MITQYVDLDKHHCGILSVLEFNTLPFIPKRIFWVTDVPQGETRGNHAHRKTEQLLVCLQGSIMVQTDMGIGVDKQILNVGQSVYVGRMVWDSQVFLTGKDILLVLASTAYDKDDYIEDRKVFMRVRNQRSPAGDVDD